MDLYLNREKINLVKKVYSASVTQEETIEMIVPDALPDILRIVDVDATLLVRSKDTDAGRVNVTGVAAAAIIYCPEGGSGVCRINVDIPFTISAVEGDITPSSSVTAHVSLISADASIVNPRKFVVRVELLADIACYNDYELSVCTDIDLDGDNGIELLRGSSAVTTPVAVNEKSFVISDELTLPNSNPEIGEILKTRVSLTADEAKVVGNKVIFRGGTSIALLYSPQDGGEPVNAELTSEFSQIMELDNVSEDGEFDIILMLTGAYFDKGIADGGDNRTISSELHAVAQCVALERRSIPFIRDAYSTRFSLEQTSEQLEIANRDNVMRPSSIYRGTLETPGAVSRIIAISVNTGMTEVAEGDGEITVGAPLYVSVVYIGDEGRVMSASGRFRAEATVDVQPGSVLTVTAKCGREVYGVATGGGIELRIAVDFTVTETSVLELEPISELFYDEEEPVDISNLPSLMLSRTSGEDTLWQLAKRHHSTETLILAANGMESESEVAPGQMLIIPKKR